MKRSKAELLFDRWKADLPNKDRSKGGVAGNFDELFSELSRSKITFEEAIEILPLAIKAHEPTDAVAKFTFRNMKKNPFITSTLSEFTADWKEMIADTAKQIFYSLYEIEGSAPKKKGQYGSMSAEEYRKQIKYADSHPTIDWENIKHEPIDEIDDLDFDLEDL